MGPIEVPNTGDSEKILQIVREIASLPECRNTSKVMYSDLVRRVKLLEPLFEELLDGVEEELDFDVVQSLEDLLVALGSAKELLNWVNESSKIYQAVHRGQVSSKFLKVTEQIEAALSKVPYQNLDLPKEIKEQIVLVHDQLGRAKCLVDSPDPQLQMDMAMIEKEGEHEVPVLRRLSENLHLRTIEDLRKESRAFHEIIVTIGADMDDTLELMTSLFKRLNDYLLTVSPETCKSDAEKDLTIYRSPIMPDEFRCPLSLELMMDPVIISSGQTYERSCIQRWFDAGHKICPKTQQTLVSTTITPNYVLKGLITMWCDNNGLKPPKKNAESGSGSPSDCDRTSINALLNKLTDGNTEHQRAAAGELRLLAKRNADNRVCIAKAGVIPLLVGLLSSPDSRTQEHAVTALLNLSIHEANKNVIVDAGAIPYVVEVLKNGSMEARENAAATLFSISVIDGNKVTIGAAGAIPLLIDLLREGTPRGKKDAAMAIFNLLIYQANKVKAVRAGIVPSLMRLLDDSSGGMVDEALAILAMLANHPDGKEAVGQGEPIPLLVEIIRTGSLRNRENAVSVLLSLCMDDILHLKVAMELGAAEALKELSECGTDRAKRKASSLLELLQRADGNGDSRW